MDVVRENQAENPLVSIITVSFNGKDFLDGLFTSLEMLSYQPVEVILVDNASSDGSAEFTRSKFPWIKVIANQQNFMYARGNNEGIKAAEGEFVCLINNDVLVEPDFLQPIVRALQKEPELGACQPKIMELDNPSRFEYSGAAGGFIDRFGYPFMRGRVFFDLEEDRGQYDRDVKIFWASGACLVARKKIFDEIGYLDENFVLHMEEIDLCWRMHLHNWKIRCISGSKIYHKGGGTLSASNPRKLYWNFRNNIFLLIKNLSAINLVKVLLVRVFLDKVAFFSEIFQGNFRSASAIIRAYLWLVFHLPLMWKRRQTTQKKRAAPDAQISGLIYPGSIVWEYFINKRRKFTDLRKINILLKKIM